MFWKRTELRAIRATYHESSHAEVVLGVRYKVLVHGIGVANHFLQHFHTFSLEKRGI